MDHVLIEEVFGVADGLGFGLRRPFHVLVALFEERDSGRNDDEKPETHQDRTRERHAASGVIDEVGGGREWGRGIDGKGWGKGKGV